MDDVYQCSLLSTIIVIYNFIDIEDIIVAEHFENLNSAVSTDDADNIYGLDYIDKNITSNYVYLNSLSSTIFVIYNITNVEHIEDSNNVVSMDDGDNIYDIDYVDHNIKIDYVYLFFIINDFYYLLNH